MPDWLLSNVQWVSAIFFAILCVHVEWRRVGVILLSFALFYYAMSFVNYELMAANETLFRLLYIASDLLGSLLILIYCEPLVGAKSYQRKHYICIAGILISCWVASYLNYRHYNHQTVSLGADPFEIVMFSLAVFLVLSTWAGVKDVIYEALKFLAQVLVGNNLPAHISSSVLLIEPDSRASSGKGSVGGRHSELGGFSPGSVQKTSGEIS